MNREILGKGSRGTFWGTFELLGNLWENFCKIQRSCTTNGRFPLRTFGNLGKCQFYSWQSKVVCVCDFHLKTACAERSFIRASLKKCRFEKFGPYLSSRFLHYSPVPRKFPEVPTSVEQAEKSRTRKEPENTFGE